MKDYILKILRKRNGLDENDKSNDKQLKSMSKDEMFNEMLSWNGLLGWDEDIKQWIRDIYNVNLKSK